MNGKRSVRALFESGLMACLSLLLLLAAAPGCFAATIEVAAGKSITDAISQAKAGDTIRIAAGKYGGPVKVTKPRLTITSATAPGGEPDVVIESAGTALVDANDTVWRGVAFRTKNKSVPIADLSKFSGRVEYCRFDAGGNTRAKAIATISGSGTFHGTVFANQSAGGGEGVRIVSGSPKFTYCRFENLDGGAVSIKDGGAKFINCLFVRNGHVLNRIGTSKGVDMTNCIFFLNYEHDLFKGTETPAVTISNGIYTPARLTVQSSGIRDSVFTEVVGIAEQRGVKLSKTRSISPRFVSLRRRAILNLGIDDNRCVPVWFKITELADKYKYPITLSAHVSHLTPDRIQMIEDGHKRGHEIASHGMSHAPFFLEEGLAVSYSDSGAKSAYLTLGDNRVLKAYIDDKIALEVQLGKPYDKNMLTIGQLSERLASIKIKAELADDYYRDIPAYFLEPFSKVDLTFKNFAPTLGIRNKEYMAYEISDSKRELDKRLKLGKNGVLALTYPLTVNSRMIAELAKKSGYVCGRAGNSQDSFSPYRSGFDPYRIFGENMMYLVPMPNIEAAKMRDISHTLLDFITDNGGVMSLYSHAENELSVKNWGVLLDAIHENGQITVTTLVKMTETMKKQGKLNNKDGRYYMTQTKDLSDYHLRANSPLRGAGKASGLTHDFEGKPLPKGNPSIGLYQ